MERSKMKRTIFLFLVFPALSFSQQSKIVLPIIPQPNEVIAEPGNFQLTQNTVIVVPQITADEEGKYFQSQLETLTGMHLQIVRFIPENTKYIFFQVVDADYGATNFYQLLITEAS